MDTDAHHRVEVTHVAETELCIRVALDAEPQREACFGLARGTQMLRRYHAAIQDAFRSWSRSVRFRKTAGMDEHATDMTTRELLVWLQARHMALRASVSVLMQYVSPSDLTQAMDYLQTVQFSDDDTWSDGGDPETAEVIVSAYRERDEIAEMLHKYREITFLRW